MKQLLKSELFIHLKSKTLIFVFLLILVICLLIPQMMYISWGDSINKHVRVLKSLSLATDDFARSNIHGQYNFYKSMVETTPEQWLAMEMEPPTEDQMDVYREEYEKALKFLNHNNQLIINSYKMTKSYSGRYLLTFIEEEYLLNTALLEALDNDYPLYELYLGSYTKELMIKKLEKTEILLENDFELEYNRYDQNYINYVLFLLTDYPMFFIVMAMVYYAIRTFSDNSNPETYKIIYSSAHSRTSINIVKMFVTTFVLLFAFFAAFGIASIYVCISYGLGEPLYPVIVSLSDTNVLLTTKLHLILSQLPFTILTFIAMINLTYFISMRTNSNDFTFNFMGIYTIIHGLYLLSERILKYSPLYYLTIHETLYFDKGLSIIVLSILLSFSILIFISTIVYGNRKDLLGVK